MNTNQLIANPVDEQEPLQEDINQEVDTSSIVIIPFRLEATIRPADQVRGSFYDHYLTRKITNHVTATIIVEGMIRTQPEGQPDLHPIHILNNYHQQLSYNLDNHANWPEYILDDELGQDQSFGLLLIPGMARKTIEKLPNHCQLRQELESRAIRKARLRGQPILGICAGSWRIWEIFGELYVATPNGYELRRTLQLQDVQDHMYYRMTSLSSLGETVGNNEMVHYVLIQQDSLLSCIMDFQLDAEVQKIPVNSVHWKSPVDADHPVLSVSAISIGNCNAKHRHGEMMQPEEEIVEAFESKYGAPVIGIQWHPEAFYNNTNVEFHPNSQLNVLKFMTKAGDAYQSKRAFLTMFSGF
ncbi:uncharacterized protein TRIADDRAFT_54342 [Trichoplax adhaerens]|uniref:Folate gamma-glutamyl hydrolase n=1 Tax=Trichoplax adhaerens TaxID=10228 RepID=B3RRS0_TRIAD|nr:predicted protein [Trichoplax adhaerens]EDV26399.1 predicted protein [Trichoplax adhaerens]|eukprot:XP_002110395.1 predicted protein [Trichoplax adhaerens]